MGRWGIPLIAAISLIVAYPLAIADPPATQAPATPAPAADPLESTYGNTVRILSKDGETTVYFNRDGTFSSSGPKGDKFGSWKIVGDKVCTHTKDGGESCGVVRADRQVGDRWTQTIDSEEINVTITAGR